MSTKLDPEELAAKHHRYYARRESYAAAIREHSQPIADELDAVTRERDELRELVRDAMQFACVKAEEDAIDRIKHPMSASARKIIKRLPVIPRQIPQAMNNERNPLVTMAYVRLHCGELNEREAVACRWIIERYELLIDEWAEDLKHIDTHNPWRAAEHIEELVNAMGR